jgi:hypothetical protein
MDRERLARRSTAFQRLAGPARLAQHPSHQILQQPLADDFPQLAARRLSRREFEHFPGPVIGEQDALPGVDGDDALHHAAEHGPQLLAILIQLHELPGQLGAHVIERARQRPHLVGAVEVDLVAIVALGNTLRTLGDFAKRPGDPRREYVRQHQRQPRRRAGHAPDQPVQVGRLRLDFRHRPSHAHTAHGLARFVDAHGEVHHGLAHRGTVARGPTEARGARRLDLRAIRVVLDFGRIVAVRLHEHLTIRGQQRDAHPQLGTQCREPRLLFFGIAAADRLREQHCRRPQLALDLREHLLLHPGDDSAAEQPQRRDDHQAVGQKDLFARSSRIARGLLII